MFAPRNPEDIDSSYCTSFINCLRQDENLNKGGIPSPFVLLKDLYRIIASEWIVVNTCWERELNTIEWHLEREEPRLEHLDRYLKSLFISRRRITLYETLVQDQLSACRVHGRKFWDKSSNPDESEAVADTVDTLEMDFEFVANLLQRNAERVARNINLLTALISVEESRVGIAKSKSLEALTVAATVFLPFTLVASIMSMNGAFAPGQVKHWVFWAFSIPISLIVVTFHLIYRKVGSVK